MFHSWSHSQKTERVEMMDKNTCVFVLWDRFSVFFFSENHSSCSPCGRCMCACACACACVCVWRMCVHMQHWGHNPVWQPELFAALEINISPQPQGHWRPLRWLGSRHPVDWKCMCPGELGQGTVQRNRTFLAFLTGDKEQHFFSPWEVNGLLKSTQKI